VRPSDWRDYVLALLFLRCVSDRYSDIPKAPVVVPARASFDKLVALKGKKDIGDLINRQIIGPLAAANEFSGMPDFNDTSKLGDGRSMVERLTKLISIFEDHELDSSEDDPENDETLTGLCDYLLPRFALASESEKAGVLYSPRAQ
jgi:type I restriction enzyme M protein